MNVHAHAHANLYANSSSHTSHFARARWARCKERLLLLTELGAFVQFESLLSTHGGEMCMIKVMGEEME